MERGPTPARSRMRREVRELTLQVQAIREDIESWKAKEAMAENREIIYEHETDGQVRLDYIYFVTYIDYS